MQVDKITAAKHQLDTAIELFFLDRDSISIRTLLSSAWSILYNLHRKRGLESSRDWMVSCFPDYRPGKIREILTNDWNFFKHARNDAEEILEFDGGINERLLMFAVNDFSQLAGHTTFLMEVFQLWFIAKNEADFKNNLFDDTQLVFPNLAAFSPGEQKGLARKAMNDPQLYELYLEGRQAPVI